LQYFEKKIFLQISPVPVLNKVDPGYHTLEIANEKPYTDEYYANAETDRKRQRSSEQLLRPASSIRKDGLIITSPTQSMCGSVRYRRDLDSDGNAINESILKPRVSKSKRKY